MLEPLWGLIALLTAPLAALAALANYIYETYLLFLVNVILRG